MIERFSATAKGETLATARRRVAEGLAPSLSAYIQRALDNENMARTLDDLLRELDAEFGQATQHEKAWARDVLGL